MGLKSSGSRSSIRNVSTNVPPGFTLTNQGATVGIPDSGVSRWTFDNQDTDAGTAFDIWGSNDGTINGATTGASGANQTYATSEAYSFDGTDNYVDADFNPSSAGLTEASISGWYNQSVNLSAGENHTVVGGNDESGGQIILRLQNTNGTVGWDYHTFDGSTIHGCNEVFTGAVPTDTWVHVVGTFNGSEYRFYYNGDREATVTDSTFSIANSNLGIGAQLRSSTTPQYFHTGKLDDVRIYNKGLTDQEVTNLYNNGDIRVN